MVSLFGAVRRTRNWMFTKSRSFVFGFWIRLTAMISTWALLSIAGWISCPGCVPAPLDDWEGWDTDCGAAVELLVAGLGVGSLPGRILDVGVWLSAPSITANACCKSRNR